MTYLLTLLLTGLLAWPFYYRLKVYEKHVKPFIGIIPAAFIAVGTILVIRYIQVHGNLAHILSFPDIITTATFIILSVAITIFHGWMIFGAESFQSSQGSDSFEGVMCGVILGAAISLLFGMLSAYPIIISIMELS